MNSRSIGFGSWNNLVELVTLQSFRYCVGGHITYHKSLKYAPKLIPHQNIRSPCRNLLNIRHSRRTVVRNEEDSISSM